MSEQNGALSVAINQPAHDLPLFQFRWVIRNFPQSIFKEWSSPFVAGGYSWELCVRAGVDESKLLETELQQFSAKLRLSNTFSLPYGRTIQAYCSVALVNHYCPDHTVIKGRQHYFNHQTRTCTFFFIPLQKFYDSTQGYLANGTLIIEADVHVRKVVDYLIHDYKNVTSFVGLRNQGATCYLNSLIQILYHIPYFRKVVYYMPTTENDITSNNIPLALRSLFYDLEHNDGSVSTTKLTKSFGWDNNNSCIQHDVHELNRVLCEKLEDKMQGTIAEGTIQQLFGGHIMNYIECIDVDYKSTIKEPFYDLQLDVKGCQDVYASFDKYVEVEQLKGDNKYHANQHGLQEARKYSLFVDFPPILQLQLKRFNYDLMKDTMVKINDHYEFPLQLDLDRDNGRYLSPHADRSVRNLYTLHSVLVHCGDGDGGHYYAFIRPALSRSWFKFDDEFVTKEQRKSALEDQYGCEGKLHPKDSSAYMLVYIRESDKDKIMCNVDHSDIEEHLKESLMIKPEENGWR